MPPKTQPNLVLRTAVPEDSSRVRANLLRRILNDQCGAWFSVRFPRTGGRHGRAFDDVFQPRFLLCGGGMRRPDRGQQLPGRAFRHMQVSAQSPLTLAHKTSGIGRRLMQAVMDHAPTKKAPPESGWYKPRFTTARSRSMPALASISGSRLSCMQGRTRATESCRMHGATGPSAPI